MQLHFNFTPFFPVCFESVEIGDWRLQDICCCDSFVVLLSFVGSTGADDNDREFSIGHKGRSGFTALFVDLVERLLKLFALLVVLPGASQSNCIAATSILVSKFGNSVRLVLVFAPKLLTVSTATICPSFYLPITRPWLKISFRWLAFYRTIQFLLQINLRESFNCFLLMEKFCHVKPFTP